MYPIKIIHIAIFCALCATAASAFRGHAHFNHESSISNQMTQLVRNIFSKSLKRTSDWMSADKNTSPHSFLNEWIQQVAVEVAPYRHIAARTSSFPIGRDYTPTRRHPMEVQHGELKDGYYRFIPFYVGSSVSQFSFESRCFHTVHVTDTLPLVDGGIESTSDSIVVTMNASHPVQPGISCEEMFLLATVNDVTVITFKSAGMQQAVFKKTDSPSGSLEWLNREGVRIFNFLDDGFTTILDLLDTISLYVPSLTTGPGLDAASAARNAHFIEIDAGVHMTKRNITEVNLNPDFYQSGDILAILRLDGLATMEIFGTGQHTDHIAMFWRFPDGLYVVESTDKTNYWPHKNIQKTKWEDWLPLAKAASFNIAILPLSKEKRDQLNLEQAESYINQTLGLPYGYHNFLWGYIDTPNKNWPWPFSFELAELVFAFVDKVVPSIGTKIWGEAMNKRLGTTNLDTIQVSNAAAQRGMNYGQLTAIPEQDDWVYSDGPSMVCDVYACSILKAGGLFGSIANDIQCAEFQNKDLYILNFFNTTSRPTMCHEADPDVPYCQILGDYRMYLTGVNSVEPYPNMNQRCAGEPPLYKRESGC